MIEIPLCILLLAACFAVMVKAHHGLDIDRAIRQTERYARKKGVDLDELLTIASGHFADTQCETVTIAGDVQPQDQEWYEQALAEWLAPLEFWNDPQEDIYANNETPPPRINPINSNGIEVILH